MKKILMIEDDRDHAMALGIRLRKAGYEVLLAEDAVQGFAQARAARPDLIILDLGLPGGGGFALLENARHFMDAALIPVVVLTARDPSQNRDRAIELGAAAFFQKPVDNGELLAAIARLTEGVPEPPDESIPVSRLKREEVCRWREKLRHAPDDLVTLNDLAWVLATACDPGLRNVPEAVKISQRLHNMVAPLGTPQDAFRKEAPELLLAVMDTLAAVCAADGNFEQAEQFIREALALAVQLQRPDTVAEIAGRLQLFEQRQPLIIDYP